MGVAAYLRLVQFFIEPCVSLDLDLPVECDDEYWFPNDPEQPFKQPADKPSVVAYLNCSLKLSQIASFAVRTIVRLINLFSCGQ